MTRNRRPSLCEDRRASRCHSSPSSQINEGRSLRSNTSLGAVPVQNFAVTASCRIPRLSHLSSTTATNFYSSTESQGFDDRHIFGRIALASSRAAR
ncbi:MAG TPA: hypothetical protein DGU45_06515 [Planctomycetes bacterium]|nr:hypothetical protein [Planctomycetota bacterium]